MPRIPITITDYTKDISKATESFLAGTPRPNVKDPYHQTIVQQNNKHSHNKAHLTEKVEKQALITLRAERAGYNISRQDTTSATPYDT